LEILPANWAGTAARRLCADLYPRLLLGSERWLDGIAIDESGDLLPRAEGLANRFQGP